MFLTKTVKESYFLQSSNLIFCVFFYSFLIFLSWSSVKKIIISQYLLDIFNSNLFVGHVHIFFTSCSQCYCRQLDHEATNITAIIWIIWSDTINIIWIQQIYSIWIMLFSLVKCSNQMWSLWYGLAKPILLLIMSNKHGVIYGLSWLYVKD